MRATTAISTLRWLTLLALSVSCTATTSEVEEFPTDEGLEGGACLQGVLCIEGLVCNAATQVCERPGQEGAACVDGTLCAEGLVCDATTQIGACGALHSEPTCR